jgi:hypothetical protein
LATSTPSLAYLALDAYNDPVFADGTSLTGADAVAQAIFTRLNLFLGEWFESLNLGLPVFQQMLGQLGSQQGLAAMRLAVIQNVIGGPYVTAVTSAQVNFVNGALTFTVSAQTVFGPVTISNLPGADAVIEGT